MEYVGAGCPNLSHLDVAHCYQLTNKSVEYVCTGCQKLKHLDIRKCPEMTDDVMKHICKSNKLNVLKLSDNSNLLGTYFSLIPSSLVHLTELHVHDCFSLDEKHMDKLKKEMPHLNILGNYTNNGET
jgi:F-box/leucine-rich repeat protein 2/20